MHARPVVAVYSCCPWVGDWGGGGSVHVEPIPSTSGASRVISRRAAVACGSSYVRRVIKLRRDVNFWANFLARGGRSGRVRRFVRWGRGVVRSIRPRSISFSRDRTVINEGVSWSALWSGGGCWKLGSLGRGGGWGWTLLIRSEHGVARIIGSCVNNISTLGAVI